MKTRFSRRDFLKGSALTGLMAAFAGLPRLAFAQPDDSRGDVLVVVFLRGGADALNMIVPYAEDAYYTARPHIAIPRPDASDALKVLDLDSFFGLHPAMSPLLPLFKGGQMMAIHAAGTPYPIRSHFDAMEYIEGSLPGSDNISIGAPSTIVMPSIGHVDYQPQHSAHYPQTEFAQVLRHTAALIRADVGLEAACIDLGGWDTHVNQGGIQGIQAALMTQLAEGLAAFHQDMGADMDKVSVVVISEFGRKLTENAYGGTDHGHGGALLVMSDTLNTGPVFTNWPGLAPAALNQGDLAVTTDYRDILTELLSFRLKNTDIASIFPNYTAKPLNLFAV